MRVAKSSHTGPADQPECELWGMTEYFIPMPANMTPMFHKSAYKIKNNVLRQWTQTCAKINTNFKIKQAWNNKYSHKTNNKLWKHACVTKVWSKMLIIV